VVRAWKGQNLTRFDDDEIYPGVANMKDSFHAVCGMRIPNGDYGLAVYGSANEALHAAPAPCCAQRKNCKTSVNSESSHVVWSLLFSGNYD